MLMQDELDDALMHLKGFGEGQCFANKAPQALAQGVVDTSFVARPVKGEVAVHAGDVLELDPLAQRDQRGIGEISGEIDVLFQNRTNLGQIVDRAGIDIKH